LYVVEKLPLTRATWDAYERVLNSGVTLPAPDRVSAMTTEAGPTHSQLVVAVVSVETYSEVRVPRTARTKAIEDVKTRRAGSTGIVQLYGDELRRLGLM
jgi:hypothetical protein